MSKLFDLVRMQGKKFLSQTFASWSYVTGDSGQQWALIRVHDMCRGFHLTEPRFKQSSSHIKSISFPMVSHFNTGDKVIPTIVLWGNCFLNCHACSFAYHWWRSISEAFSCWGSSQRSTMVFQTWCVCETELWSNQLMKYKCLQRDGDKMASAFRISQKGSWKERQENCELSNVDQTVRASCNLTVQIAASCGWFSHLAAEVWATCIVVSHFQKHQSNFTLFIPAWN